MTGPQSQITGLLDNLLVARLEQMRLLSSRRFTNRSRGEHVSRGGGSSNEFKDFRDYAAGDDLRFLDWNSFARLRRPYVKLFHQEEELHLLVLVDQSASMEFEGKAERARQLAAALSLMGLMGGERVSVQAFGDPEQHPVRREVWRGRGRRQDLFRYLENLPVGGETTLPAAMDQFLRLHRGRGAIYLISDFLSPEPLDPAIKRAYSAGLVPYALQVLGPSELRPEMPQDMRLLDAETQAILDVTGTGDLLKLYDGFLAELMDGLSELCKQRGGRFLSLDADLDIGYICKDVLRRRGWAQ